MAGEARDTGSTAALARTELAREAAPSELASTAELPAESSAVPEAAVRLSGEVPRFDDTARRFETGGVIGSGGMGEVVRQVDKNIGRAVAKKMLHPEMHNAVSLQRFVREARVQGQLEHPAVVPVHDFGVDEDGRLFFTMKRIRGQTLSQILDKLAARDREYEARFSRHKLLSSFVQVCLAIEYAHKRGVIHRDLKPSNIMLGDFGEVYVLDWGLAKLTSRSEGDELPVARPSNPRQSTPDVTSDGDMLGTPLYMAPEQMRGRHAAADERADVFSLGAILFEILANEPFRRGKTLLALLSEAENKSRVERPSERGAEVPAELDELCAAALAREPEGRVASARALADAVERYLKGDRDLAARKAQAAELVVAARARLDAPRNERAAALVLALREVLKALALHPGDDDAQRLLVSLMLEGSRDLSPEAYEAFARGDVEMRKLGLRRGIFGYAGWLATFPLAVAVGIRSWPAVLVLVVLTIACLALTIFILRSRVVERADIRVPAVILAVLSAVVAAATSAWLGPFVLTPLVAIAATIMFLVHLRRDEGGVVIGLFMLAGTAPFLVEWLHVFPPAYTFTGGDIVLHARMLSLPELPTILYLAYTAAAFIGILGYFVIQLRKKQRDAERRLFGQAWLLEHLFPSGAAGAGQDQSLRKEG